MKKKWQYEVDAYSQTVGNDELLTNVINLSGGDDYDGCFTKRGQYEFDVYYAELEKRLKEIGFI